MKKPVKLMLIIVGAVVLIAAVAVAVYFYLKSSNSGHKKPVVLTPAQRRALQVDIPSMTTNVANDSGLMQFGLTLQASDNSTKGEITDLLPEVQDQILSTIHHFSADELRAADGQRKLESQIESGVNQLLVNGHVTSVLFTQWIVQ